MTLLPDGQCVVNILTAFGINAEDKVRISEISSRVYLLLSHLPWLLQGVRWQFRELLVTNERLYPKQIQGLELSGNGPFP